MLRTLSSLHSTSKKLSNRAADIAHRRGNHVHHFSDLDKDAVLKLTKILSFQQPPESPRNDDYVKSVFKMIDELPSHLKYEYNSKTSSKNDERPPLCELHNRLSAELLHSVLYWVRTVFEGTIWLRLEPHMNLDSEKVASFKILREVPPMWLGLSWYHSHRFNLELDQSASPSPQWTTQQNGCPGCILARIGGQEEVLCHLLAAYLVNGGTPAEGSWHAKKISWIEGWLDAAAAGNRDRRHELDFHQNMLARELTKLVNPDWKLLLR